MRRTLTGLAALILALVAVPAARPAEPAAASLGPAYRDAHLGLQTGAVVVMSSGDISPPTNETKVDDHATSEIILAAHPDLVLTLGDNQYETGSGAMFHSAIGFDGSWDRIKGLIRPAEGNHDAADPGPGSPGFQEYFADNLANLECTRLNPPCRPDLGYYDFDLPNAKLIIAFAAGVLATLLVWLLVSVLPHRAGQPTPTSTTILLAPTTSPAQAAASTTTLSTTPVPTGRGPSAFTTTSAPGFIQVIVEGARCAGFVGDGWQVRYRVTNAGPTDTGSIVGQVDDSPPVILEPARQLAQGDSFAEEALLPGGGDAIVVTWVGQVERVASFPIEVPNCPTDPADERAAEQATTTLGAP